MQKNMFVTLTLTPHMTVNVLPNNAYRFFEEQHMCAN